MIGTALVRAGPSQTVNGADEARSPRAGQVTATSYHWPAATAKVESAGATRVSVLINSENKLHLNGQPIGLSQLAPRVKELLGDAPAGDRTVVLKVHRESQALQFEPVIEAISEAGGDLVHILEEKRP